MANYNFDEIIDRTGTDSMKYDAGRVYNPDLPEKHIPMWVADMDFACPQPMLDAMHERLNRRILGYANYTSTLGDNYFEAVCGWLKRRHNIDAKKENISFAEGVINAAYALVDCMTKPGESVMVFTPSYQYIYDPIWKLGRNAIKMPLINTDGYYSIDFDAFEKAAARPDVTMLMFCSPHNPSGRVWTEEELRRIGDICLANGVRIASDEIHCDLTRKASHMVSITSLYPQDPRIVTMMSTSKTFNCAGNHHSYIIVYDQEIKEILDDNNYCGTMNPLSVEAVIAAYTKCEDWLDELRDYIDANFAYLDEFIKENLPRAKFRIAEGTYLAWIDLSGYVSDYEGGMKELETRISKAGLYLEYAGEFVENDDGFARMNMACPRSTVQKACEILKSVLEG